MPGWHAKTKELVAAKKLAVLGIIPEQHPDRARLFMAWKDMDWPVLADPLNVLEVKAVPITLLIDKHRIIRYRNPSSKDLDTFLSTEYSSSPQTSDKAPQNITPHLTLALKATHERTPDSLNEAITAYRLHLEQHPRDHVARFRLGVLARTRYDSPDRERDDFQSAIRSWQMALAGDPGQYIWRRRLQQFGPRLDKPYPFYDWVESARGDLEKRGLTPPHLRTEPVGAEIAQPGSEPEVQADQDPVFPDPDGKLPDNKALLEVTVTHAPHSDPLKNDHIRLHLDLYPAPHAHWSSDSQELTLWLQPKEGKAIPLSSTATFLKANEETSTAPRHLECEIQSSQIAEGQLILFGFLCTEEPPLCLFFRKEIPLKLSD